jgi:catechol 2,3-dioxygenase-like lactoylglutathione lyase family enzyme
LGQPIEEKALSSMPIHALDHVVLTVSDVSAAVAFYERLGMRRETFDGDRIALHFGAQKLNLHRTGAEVEPHARYPTPGSADLCFLVEGPLEQVFEALATAGIRVELGPVERTGATGPIRSLYVRDPDGNLVELSEAEAPVEHAPSRP